MPQSFLPEAFAHPYEIDERFSKSVAYFSMEFAIHQSFKIYSGGLGFLAGSHMRSAADLRQNLTGIGISWTYGYYNQSRGENRELAVQFRRKPHSFLKHTGLRYTIDIHGNDIWVEALYLPADTFGTVPMFFLTTDVEGNSPDARAISHRLYDADNNRRIAQYMLLGLGGARLLEELGVDPDVYHLNEAHGLAAAFHLYNRFRDLEEVKKRLVFTTHTPEEAGNEKTDFNLMQNFHFFGHMPEKEVRRITGTEGNVFNHSLAALRMSRIANGVSKLHGEVARKMWENHEGICPITHVTNAQNKKFWVDKRLEKARKANDAEALMTRKREIKEFLFGVVADQTSKLFKPDVLTIVWARRFAAYKRAELITRDLERFKQLVTRTENPVQVIWAGKPYPFDYGAIDIFNHLINLTRDLPNATVLVGYELHLSRVLKYGADVWLNNPVVTREASGTSGMSAAMNASLNFSTYDGWVREFCDVEGKGLKSGKDVAFIVPPPEPLEFDKLDQHDLDGIYSVLDERIVPLYYGNPDGWREMLLNSMNEVVPFFDSDRMATEYYEKIYGE
jgi:starch phosphorylase